MPLTELLDKLETTVVNGGSISDMKGQITFLRDQVEALEREHAALAKVKSELDVEFAKAKAVIAKIRSAQNETSGFGDIGGVH